MKTFYSTYCSTQITPFYIFSKIRIWFISANYLVLMQMHIPYALHYKPWLVYFLPHFSLRFIRIVERLVLETIYVLNTEILQFLSLKSAVYNQEWVIMHTVAKILNLWLRNKVSKYYPNFSSNVLKNLNGGNKCRRWCSQDEIYAIVAETQHAKCCIRLTNISKNFTQEHFLYGNGHK